MMVDISLDVAFNLACNVSYVLFAVSSNASTAFSSRLIAISIQSTVSKSLLFEDDDLDLLFDFVLLFVLLLVFVLRFVVVLAFALDTFIPPVTIAVPLANAVPPTRADALLGT